MEPLGSSHLLGSLMHRLDDGRAEWLGDISDTEGDDVSLGMHYLKSIHLLGDVSEQVVVLEIEEMGVY